MTNVWAMFAVVFLAIYTANLAAFMITREEFYDFSGVDDHRLARPTSHKPMIKFGTVPWTHTDSTLAKYFKDMYAYMKNYNKNSVADGIEAVINGCVRPSLCLCFYLCAGRNAIREFYPRRPPQQRIYAIRKRSS